MYSSLSPLKDLTVNDVRKFDLEKRLMYLPLSPIFFVYYTTVQGDILGTLRITDYELLFEPLNPVFKGLFSYSTGNLNDNCRTSFVVNLEDIACKPMSIPCPSMDDEDPEEIGIVMQVQINLRHTGNYYYMSNEAKTVVDRGNQYGIASFHLKGKISALDGKAWNNDERRKQAELIVSRIQTKINERHESNSPRGKHPSMTCVPYFDIDFSSVLHPHDESPPSKAPLRITLHEVNSNLDLFKEVFGIKFIKESILELKNQSFTPLNYIFPSIIRKSSDGGSPLMEDEDEDNDLFKRSTAKDGRRPSARRYHIPDEMKVAYGELMPDSEIITVGAAKMVL